MHIYFNFFDDFSTKSALTHAFLQVFQGYLTYLCSFKFYNRDLDLIADLFWFFDGWR